MLLGNGTRDSRNPIKLIAQFPGNERGNFGMAGENRNFRAGEAAVSGQSSKAGRPSGYRHPYAWVMPQVAGGLKAFKEANGLATATLTLVSGRNVAGTSDGVAAVSGTAQLVVSGAGSADGVATASGNILAALAAAGTSDGAATASGAVNALGWVAGTSDGVATASIVSYATGQLIGSIAPAVELEASIFSTYLLDSEDVETGMTLREALRIVLSASGGKVAISGDTVTIRDVNDTKDRITATTDTNGQRTAVTLDAD